MRTVTYEQCAPEASVVVGDDRSCHCAIEDFWEHKEQADLRLRRYGSRKVGSGAGSGGAS
jgi:sulfopropanediol 3-dehydrogenase